MDLHGSPWYVDVVLLIHDVITMFPYRSKTSFLLESVIQKTILKEVKDQVLLGQTGLVVVFGLMTHQM